MKPVVVHGNLRFLNSLPHTIGLVILYEQVFGMKGFLMAAKMVILGIDPGLAHTGWGLVVSEGAQLSCLAYGCIKTSRTQSLPCRLQKIYQQITAVVAQYQPRCVGVETVWFGSNAQSAFATGQARGAALAACAEADMEYREYSPRQIKLAVVGTGDANKEQVQYMVKHLLSLDCTPSPDHCADALAAAICFSTHAGIAAKTRKEQC